MPLTLTDADRAAMDAAIATYNLDWSEDRPTFSERVYLAGMRAQAERDAVICERDLVNRPDDPPANYFDGGLRHCASLIREAAK